MKENNVDSILQEKAIRALWAICLNNRLFSFFSSKLSFYQKLTENKNQYITKLLLEEHSVLIFYLNYWRWIQPELEQKVQYLNLLLLLVVKIVKTPSLLFSIFPKFSY